ncbi:hypothetical protein JCM6882_006403 [Rhodosporidiobolus microsporus]
MDNNTVPSLVVLPPELLLRIFALLDPQSIARLAQACSTFSAVAASESLWRELVLALVREHGVQEGSEAEAAPPLDEREPRDGTSSARSWRDVARFLLPLSDKMGWFCSSKQFTSRLTRVSIRTSSPSGLFPSPESPPPHYTVLASHVRPRNLYDSPLHRLPPSSLPFGAVTDALAPSAYMISPNLNPTHPYTGLSVDVLEPEYDFQAAMFEVTPEEGPVLSRPGEASSQTREGILAAAAANGILGGGAGIPGAIPPVGPSVLPPLPRISTPVRLRLALEPVEQRVERGRGVSRLNSDGSAPLDSSDLEEGGEPSDAEDGPALHRPGRLPRDRAAANRAALFALVSGRLPRTPWPTFPLVGLEEVDRAELSGEGEEPLRGTVLRASGGAFRGLSEHLTLRGGERALARVEETDEKEEAYVSGFRLRAKRTPRTSFTRARPAEAGASTSGSSVAGATQENGATAAARRRGVGPNGGIAVLWNGGEADPDERPAVTILRAGDEAEGGVILRLPGSPEPADPAPLPTTAGPPPAPPSPSHSPDSTLADAIDSSTESFFPIKAPARPLRWDSPSVLDAHGEIRASSLEGLWVGTYGAHGIEFVNVTVGFAEVPVLAPMGQTWGGAGGGAGGPSQNDIRAASRPRTRLQRLVTATKVTGDANVPSGQTSWLALLPSPELSSLPSLSVSPASPASPSSPSSPLSPLADPSPLLDGPLPTLSASLFDHYSSLDPLSQPYLARPPDWSAGLAERGWGRIALTGFTSPSWVGAEVRFLREEVRVRRDRGAEGGEGEDGEEDERVVESVEEIHLAWRELHKVAKFRRVRV